MEPLSLITIRMVLASAAPVCLVVHVLKRDTVPSSRSYVKPRTPGPPGRSQPGAAARAD